MTRTAVTPAGRGSGAKAPAATRTGTKAPAGTHAGTKAPAARTSGHAGAVRKHTSPHAPRRVSGPLRDPARGRVQARPPKAPPRGVRRSAQTKPVAQRAASFVRALPDHAWLDRIIRGRAWIPLLGVMLAGIVAMQVEVLKLSAGMGRSLERSTALQSRNEILRASVAGLADDQRIERIAAGMGMVMAAPTAVDFLAAQNGANVKGAVAGIHQPSAATFTALLPATVSGVGSSAVIDPSSSASTAGTSPTAGTSAPIPSSTGSSTASSATPVTSSGNGASSQAASTPTTTGPAATAATGPTSSPTPGASSSGQASASGGTAPVGG